MTPTVQSTPGATSQRQRRPLRAMLAAALGLFGAFPVAAQQSAARQHLTPLPAQTAVHLPAPAPQARTTRPDRPTAAHGILASISSTATGGNWSAPTTWAGGVVPTASDEVTIAAGATVTLDTPAACAALTIANTASLLTSTTIPSSCRWRAA